MKQQQLSAAREKHLGRVAQGHKLAKLMKKRKQKVLKNKESEQTTVQASTYKLYDAQLYGVEILSVLAIGLLVYYEFPKKTSESTFQKDDIFKMN